MNIRRSWPGLRALWEGRRVLATQLPQFEKQPQTNLPALHPSRDLEVDFQAIWDSPQFSSTNTLHDCFFKALY